MTTEEYLTSKNVTMEVARAFLLDNYADNLETVFSVCKEYGVSNDTIADILQSDFPGLEGEGVSSFFNANAYDGNSLGFNLSSIDDSDNSLISVENGFTEEWLNGRTLYNIDVDYNSVMKYTFTDGVVLADFGFTANPMYSSTYSILEDGILWMAAFSDTGDGTEDYIKVIENNLSESGYLKLAWEEDYDMVFTATSGNIDYIDLFFLDQSTAMAFIA